MPPKPTNWSLYGKMAIAFGVCAVGGPAFTWWLTPTEAELFAKYNPELQKRSLENRIGKQQEFDHFVGKLKEYSKSDKPIWEAAKDAEARERAGKLVEQAKLMDEMNKRKEDMRKDGIKAVPGGSL